MYLTEGRARRSCVGWAGTCRLQRAKAASNALLAFVSIIFSRTDKKSTGSSPRRHRCPGSQWSLPSRSVQSSYCLPDPRQHSLEHGTHSRHPTQAGILLEADHYIEYLPQPTWMCTRDKCDRGSFALWLQQLKHVRTCACTCHSTWRRMPLTSRMRPEGGTASPSGTPLKSSMQLGARQGTD